MTPYANGKLQNKTSANSAEIRFHFVREIQMSAYKHAMQKFVSYNAVEIIAWSIMICCILTLFIVV
ncbi:hypothetical protein T07_6055 [Trichinella nelsoni]|uniref:Uncharacterized protein n=1 Tax=Trichinella nelsoni TaxID=6336 RepID=A0A0V0SHR6_9BILA|nr:hypothetical protein T07_6055 [Trichinella nelsoni]